MKLEQVAVEKIQAKDLNERDYILNDSRDTIFEIKFHRRWASRSYRSGTFGQTDNTKLDKPKIVPYSRWGKLHGPTQQDTRFAPLGAGFAAINPTKWVLRVHRHDVQKIMNTDSNSANKTTTNPQT